MKTFDLIVRNGMVADGTGREPVVADVAITNGRIVRVEPRITGRGREELRADDLLVTPGFVDIHTHYDGQITWDHTLGPSSQLGVTTVVTSNCGVGFAPCKPEHRELLIKLMEGIEDIPDVVMAEGLPWLWESFEEYLDFLDTRQCDVDFATQVPHAPVRVNVMGQRAADREPATAHEMHAMAAIVRAGILAGALGFTTSRTVAHRTKSGALAPTITAAEEELRTIALGIRAAGAGVLQMIDDFEQTDVEDSAAFGMWRRIAEAAGRPLSFTLVELRAAPERWRELLHFLEKANADGLTIRGQVATRAIGTLLGLSASAHPFSFSPTYQTFAHLPLVERVAIMRRTDVRAALLQEHSDGVPRPGFVAPDFAYALGDPPNYEPPADQRLEVRAKALGISPLELAYDLLLADEGRTLLYRPITNYVNFNLDTTYEMMMHPHTVIGLSDGGAHVARICDASMQTYLITHWTRDRPGTRIPLGQAVKMITSDTALLIGLADRGIIAPGYRADLNVIDYDRLALGLPRIEHDLPAGGSRLKQSATGYRATVKSGVVTYNDGAPTGALPGRLIRGAQPPPA